MATLAGISQSVNRANRLMDDTGFMDSNRGMSNAAWDRNIAQARRELAEVADALAGRGGLGLYRQMTGELRRRMWRALLLSSCNAGEPEGRQIDLTTGRRIMRSLGAEASAAVATLTQVTDSLASRPNGFPVRVLRTMSRQFREAAPGTAAEIERRARVAGDPMPIPPPASSTREYMLVALDAIRRARAIERSWDAQNPRVATFVAVAATVFGVPTEQDAASLSEFASGRASSDLEDLVQEGAHIDGVMTWVGRIDAARVGVETHGRLTDPRERMRQCLQEAALEQSGGEWGTALALLDRMRTTEQRMNAWLAWLARHRDHPAYVPPGGVVTAASPSVRRL
jgi:hypothetical protein